VGPAFTPQALEPQRAAMRALAERHVARWPHGRPFRLLPRAKTLADEVFVRCVLGVRDDRRAAALVLAIRRMLASPGSPPMPIPSGNRGLLGVLGERFYRFRRRPVAALLREELRARGPVDAELDVLSCLRRAGQADEEIVEAVVPLLMAGQEPAAIGLTWVLDRAAREPGAAERLAPGQDAWSDAFVAEALRLRPPVHSLVRPLTAAFSVAGWTLPAGTVLVVPIPLLHLDPRAFAAPETFRPERFLEAEPPASYVPFGFGARRCLGQALAELQFETLVPAILARLRLTSRPRRPERQVVRATVLPPRRSALMFAQARQA
jgi:cytochrome P450